MNKQQHSHIYYILHYCGNNFFQLFQLFLLSAFSAFYFFQLCNTPVIFITKWVENRKRLIVRNRN